VVAGGTDLEHCDESREDVMTATKDPVGRQHDEEAAQPIGTKATLDITEWGESS
jgi:hypothetical protein